MVRLDAAFGVAHRINESSYEPDPLWDRAVPAIGETTVSELYGEVLVPIVGRFELELGARYSDFATGGFAQDAQTYKVLFSWGATDALRLRGGFQRANRTPNVAELYSGDNRVVTTWLEREPCNSQTQNPWGNVASNPIRLAVQELCHAIIGNDTAAFGVPGSTQANNFARPGAPPAGETPTRRSAAGPLRYSGRCRVVVRWCRRSGGAAVPVDGAGRSTESTSVCGVPVSWTMSAYTR